MDISGHPFGSGGQRSVLLSEATVVTRPSGAQDGLTHGSGPVR
ncbi:hypothetical protein EDD29_3567 [Actinocorallia herbida]|uniref:Uncharacterized protein n=1 Tax=Actinocorallia herbida TaxID=58109 RepID=A0A3N1CXP0_9ACTN|nr:hypothetical protein EDD29_3567 [Actinocorallia herbida]